MTRVERQADILKWEKQVVHINTSENTTEAIFRRYDLVYQPWQHLNPQTTQGSKPITVFHIPLFLASAHVCGMPSIEVLHSFILQIAD